MYGERNIIFLKKIHRLYFEAYSIAEIIFQT